MSPLGVIDAAPATARDEGMPQASTTPVVTRRAGASIETTFAGRVTGSMIEEACAGYRREGGAAPWLLDASATQSYAPEAVERAVAQFNELHAKHGLHRIVAVVVAPLVRMGASIVAATLRTMGSPLTIDVVDSRQAGEAIVAEAAAAARRPAR